MDKLEFALYSLWGLSLYVGFSLLAIILFKSSFNLNNIFVILGCFGICGWIGWSIGIAMTINEDEIDEVRRKSGSNIGCELI